MAEILDSVRKFWQIRYCKNDIREDINSHSYNAKEGMDELF